jgi:hypothetical protein
VLKKILLTLSSSSLLPKRWHEIIIGLTFNFYSSLLPIKMAFVGGIAETKQNEDERIRVTVMKVLVYTVEKNMERVKRLNKSEPLILIRGS